MTSEIEILIKNLESPDAEIRLLALDTLSRYQFQNDFSSETILSMQEILLGYGQIKDAEFLQLTKAAMANLKQHLVRHNKRSTASQNQMKTNNSLPFKLDELENSDAKVRKNCLIQIINHKHTDAYQNILNMLINEKDEQVLVLSIKALALISKRKIVNLLHIFIYHPEPNVRENAITAISDLGDCVDIINLLLPEINLSNPQEVINISETLSKFESKKILSYIGGRLQDDHEHRRLLAIKSLGKLSGDEIIELINISANDKSPQIRIQAAKALFGRSSAKLITPILNRLAQDADIEVSEIALEYLHSLANEITINRIKLSDAKNSLVTENIDTDNKPKTEILTEEKTKESYLTDASNVDEQIEVEFLNLGQHFFKKIKSSGVDHPLLDSNVQRIEKALTKIKQLEQSKRNQNLVKSITKAIGGNLNDKLTLQNAKLLLEEAHIDMGEAIFGLICSDEMSTQGIESSLNRLHKLFKIRKELS